MSESKKGVHQIGPNCFLFFNTPEIFYCISFEETNSSKIKIIIVKILENKTYIFDSLVEFSDFGTGDKSPQDTIKNLDFIIYNYNFVIKEDQNKINILFNTNNPKNIELSLHKLELEDDDDKLELMYKEQMNQTGNKIQELMNLSMKQEQEINKLKQNEDINLNRIKNLSQITESLLTEIENRNNSTKVKNNYNNTSYKNNNQYYNNNNSYNNNNQLNNDNNKYNNFNRYNNSNISNGNENNNKMNQYQNNNNIYNNNNQYQRININNNISKNPYNINNNEFQNDFMINKRKTFSFKPNSNEYNNFGLYKNSNNINNKNSGYNPYQ